MKPVPSYQKLRGGYYTPQPIADFLAGWAIHDATARVLEPSCGDGAMVEAAMRALGHQGAACDAIARQVRGAELDPREAVKATQRAAQALGHRAAPQVHTGDFFAWCVALLGDGERFDAVIGNPPFIRYQSFPEEHRQRAFYLSKTWTPCGRLTSSAWRAARHSRWITRPRSGPCSSWMTTDWRFCASLVAIGGSRPLGSSWRWMAVS